MSQTGKKTTRFWHLIVFLSLVIISIVPGQAWVSAQNNTSSVWVVRTLPAEEYGVRAPGGLAFSPATNNFLVWQADGSVTAISMYGQKLRNFRLDQTIKDPLNVAFDASTSSLVVFEKGKSELMRFNVQGNGLSSGAAKAAGLDWRSLGLQDAQGMSFNPLTGELFILDALGKQVLSVTPQTGSGLQEGNTITQLIELAIPGAEQLRGIAFNPQNGRLVVVDRDGQKLYEVSQEGQLTSTYDISSANLQETSSLVFAPSVDRTDDPANMNLFVLEQSRSATKSGQIVELSLTEPAALPGGTPLLPTTLIKVVDTSKAAWSPSSPDPSGIDYWPLTGRFLIVDSEVEEMNIYWAGANVFDATLSGSLVSTCDTTRFSKEPTGVAVNPATNRIYISHDEGGGKLFEVNLGPDGRYCTADDTLTSVAVSTDVEDVAVGNNTVFIAGGTDAEVWMFNLGPNGVMGGGDDGPLSHFDTAVMGFRDLEGIGYNSDAGTLLIVSTVGNERYIGELTVSGGLLRAYDVSFMGTVSNLRSDVTYAPSSQNPAVKNIYIVSRGVDNNSNSKENDGKWWEISLVGSSPSTPTPPPNTPTPAPTTPANNWYVAGIGSFLLGQSGDVPVPADYNGDGLDEIAVYRPSTGAWYISTLGGFPYGEQNDIPVPADYNGDGRTDIAVFRPSTSKWYVYGVGEFTFGAPGDVPVVGDYNGNGQADIAVFRPSTSKWYVYGLGEFTFGAPGDVPVVGDYNGDRRADIAVFRPSTSKWYVYGVGEFTFGAPGDKPVVGDYNGDGQADIAVFRPSASRWYVYGVGEFVFGASSDIPAVADFNGDGRTEIAIFRP